MTPEEIRLRIRDMLETGDIPCNEPDKVWAGRGNGSHCAACTEPIGPTQIEFEIDLQSGVVVRLHPSCHAIWREECESLTANG